MRRMVAGVGVILAAALVPACGGRPSSDSSGGSGAPGETVFNDPGIETFPNEGQTHVPVGTVVAYQTDPPTSGNHYPDPQEGGFYSQPIAAGFLVHSLEHGAVEIYYNAAMLTDAELNRIRALAAAHPGTFAQVIAVPRNDAQYAVILTAWQHRLRLAAFDSVRIDGFMTLFLGHGPEHAPMAGDGHDDH